MTMTLEEIEESVNQQLDMVIGLPITDANVRYLKMEKIILDAEQVSWLIAEIKRLREVLASYQKEKCICGHYHCPICGNQMDVYEPDPEAGFTAADYDDHREVNDERG